MAATCSFRWLMLVLLGQWWRGGQQRRWLWALAAIVGPAVGYSFPAVFVGGAISLITAYVLWTTARPPRLAGRGLPSTWPWLGSFVALVIVTRAVVGDEVQQRMAEEHWGDTFPPLGQPLRLLRWLVSTHAGGLLAYPVGGPNGGSTLTLIACAAGVALLCRRRKWLLLAVLLMPLALNFVAACLHRYPYGGHVRHGALHGARLLHACRSGHRGNGRLVCDPSLACADRALTSVLGSSCCWPPARWRAI